MQVSLIDQGLTLMLYGMGTVFVFLSLLVFATTLMSKLVSRFGPSPAIAKTDNVPPPSASSDAELDSATLSAIKKAIALHRQR